MAVSSGSTATFKEHLEELRGRMFVSVLVLLVFTAVGWSIHAWLLGIITHPLNQKLIYNSPTGGFEFIINISLMFGVAASAPIFLYNLIQFVKPALAKGLTANIWKVIIFSYLLLAAGIVFAYKLSLPFALKFLSSFATDNVESLITTNSYMSFVGIYLFGFGLIFLMPLILILASSVNIVNFESLYKFQGKMILISVIVAGIITPTPDPINQLIMAAPIITLYEVSVFIIWLKTRGQISSETVMILEKQAEELYASGKTNRADKLYRKICRSKFASAKSHGRLGVILMNNRKLLSAFDELTLAIQKDPGVASYHANIGITLLGLERFSEAVECFDKAIELAPDNPKYPRLRQLALTSMGS